MEMYYSIDLNSIPTWVLYAFGCVWGLALLVFVLACIKIFLMSRSKW